MKRLFLLAVTVLSALGMSLAADTASAQIFRRRVPMTQPPQATQAAQGPQFGAQNDAFLVDWLGADNQAEIALSQFASARTSNQEVKEFANEMIRNHTDLANKLNQTLANSRATASARTGRIPYTTGYRGPDGTVQPAVTEPQPGTTQQQPNTSQQQAAATVKPQQVVQQQPAESMAADSNLTAVNFKREIDAQLVKAIEEKLGQKKGADFDHCFVQGQIFGHTQMLAALDVARNQASPQLKPALDEAINMAQRHLNQAESLMHKLEPQASR